MLRPPELSSEAMAPGIAALPHAGSSRLRDGTRVSTLAGGFSTTEPPGRPASPSFLKILLSKNCADLCK